VSDTSNLTAFAVADPGEDVETLRAALADAHSKVDNLTIALESSRRIGAALGVVMARQRVTIDDAFELLKSVSQNSHRKLRDIADEVLYTGALPTTAGAPQPTQHA
jgi:AmiR/NasT family two-component response regulator